ncbi:hypothetical protein ATO12_02805 [Aquimarina atlantica]|uniref:Beta-lactamase-related domain-containing protein n=1 Tax=Aquimarina atlantica TaxID=1317122 RepID=A0A023C079_9FLAO|nr:serine hydrolase domain-containing protein [Aquimarina atlantica]EZH75737.1 hypothetical protein ATO12_02805 [Aquimarina atlantica]
MKIKIISIVISLALPLIIFGQIPSDSLTYKLEKLSKNNSVEGFGVAIYTRDTVLYKKGFGYADAENKLPYTTKTVQKIASISKLILGVSLMKAQEMKLLHLDDDVNDYLPFILTNPKFSNTSITIRHLATHTSGLKKLPEYDLKALYFSTPIPKITTELPFGLRRSLLNKLSKRINKNEEISLHDFLYNIYAPNGIWYSKNHFENVKPGVREIYSNSAASLIALIIEKASGMSYSEFVRKHILSVLKMNTSGFDFEMKGTKDKKSSLYHAGIKIPNDYKLLLFPAGGFETSVDDFSIFMQSMAKGYYMGNSILQLASFNEMKQVRTSSKFTHGILWEVYPSSSVGHQGDIVGVVAYAYYNEIQDRGYLLFCNTSTTKTIDKDTDDIVATLKEYYTILKPEN